MLPKNMNCRSCDPSIHIQEKHPPRAVRGGCHAVEKPFQPPLTDTCVTGALHLFQPPLTRGLQDDFVFESIT